MWASLVRLKSYDWDRFGPPETTVAYLTTSAGATRSKDWAEAIDDDSEPLSGLNSPSGENGFGMPIVMGSQPTKKALERFPRAMRVLNLKPYTHKSQEGQPLVLGGGSGNALRKGPRSTLLLRNKG